MIVENVEVSPRSRSSPSEETRFTVSVKELGLETHLSAPISCVGVLTLGVIMCSILAV